MRGGLRGVLLGLALGVIAAPARAQMAPWSPPGTVPVFVESAHPRLRFTLATEREAPPFARCFEQCSLFLYAEKYWLTVGATHDTVEGARWIEVEQPTRFRITPRPIEPAGGTLGLVGFILLGAGVVTVGYGLTAKKSDRPAFAVVGSASALAGISLVIVGAAVSPRTKPEVESQPYEPSY